MPRRKKIPQSSKRQERNGVPNWAIATGAVAVIAIIVAVLLGNRPDADQAGSRPLAELSPAERDGYYSAAPDMIIDPAKDYAAVIETGKGSITLDLYEDIAPITVNSFVFLADQGFYDGVTITDGIYAVGCAKRPCDVSRSTKDATGAALKAIQCLIGGA